ncbi:hypothetical protein Hanom_Chr04g00367741 [Helianthus anomalus]
MKKITSMKRQNMLSSIKITMIARYMNTIITTNQQHHHHHRRYPIAAVTTSLNKNKYSE